MTKNDIGAIRITPDETFVGIAASAAARFAKSVAQPGHDEDNDVEIIASDGPPQMDRGPRRSNKGAPNSGRERLSPKPFGGGPRRDGPSGGGPNSGGEGKRPFRSDGPPRTKHGVKFKAKGNRPR